MRRRHTAAEFLTWVNKLKERVKGVTFSTDLIVGFPGESEEDFQATREIFVTKLTLTNNSSFVIQQEKNTPAAQMPNQLDEDIKMERNQIY